MSRSNLIPITKIYDIYPKYSYSKDVRRFMDDIVDIDRADVYTKDEVITMLTEIQLEIEELPMYYDPMDVSDLLQQKINALRKETKK